MILDIIHKKRLGKELTYQELKTFFNGYKIIILIIDKIIVNTIDILNDSFALLILFAPMFCPMNVDKTVLNDMIGISKIFVI